MTAASEPSHHDDTPPTVDVAQLFESLPDLIGVLDARGHVVIANPAWSRVLGWRRRDLKAEPLESFMHLDDVEVMRAQLAARAATGDTDSFDCRMRCADGSHRWLEWTAVVQNDIAYVIARDVTSAKEIAVELHSSRTFLESIVDNIPNMVFVKDALELRFVRMNQAGQDLLGYTQDELFGKNDYDFFPDDEAEFFIRKDRDVLSHHEVLDIASEPIETRLLGQRILHTRKIPIFDEHGEPVYLLGIAEDITARVEGEELMRQRQETLAALATAHEAQARLTEALETQRWIATTLQRSLLPAEIPAIPGVEIAARYWPSTAGLEVGGDFYDVFGLGRRGWGIVIGDVCGKGVGAASLTAAARHSARAAARHVTHPDEVLAWVYDAVIAQVTDRFLTMAYATIDLSGAEAVLTVSLGGHPRPILVRAGGSVESLGRFGTLIGMNVTPAFHTDSTTLRCGDLVAFYTDGLTDAPDDRALSEVELAALLATHHDGPLDGVAEAIHASILERSGNDIDDDAALVLVRIE